ncbi:MAG: hypothetical protein LBV43_11800 [Prevotella sp.]|nr:hypothetical protein [Prevotella sp.]
MKRIFTILSILAISLFYSHNLSAQFIVAKDTIRGRIDFTPRLGDLDKAIPIPNDSVFYMFPPDREIDPWRNVDYYMPNRNIISGYIMGTKFMRVDDYDVIEVEKLSSHGTVSFKNEDVRILIAVANITSKDTSIKQDNFGGYTVNGKQAKGIVRHTAPKLRYQSISVTIKGKSIPIPKKVYEHLLEPEIENMVVYYNPEKTIVYIVVNNGGLDAFYQALWAVSPNGVSNPYIFDPALLKVAK